MRLLSKLRRRGFEKYLSYFFRSVPFDEKLSRIFDGADSKRRLDYLHFQYPVVRTEIVNKLKQGLNDRVHFLIPLTTGNESVTIGINFNYFNMNKVVEKGPPTYDPAAQEFREFWGERAELRRFKDGTITEAVYWQAESMHEKRLIFKDIVNFVLETKLNLKDFNIVSDQFDYVLKLYPYCGIEEANLKVVNTFDELGKLLRGMKLPLDVAAIQGISEAFSYSDAFPPAQLNYKAGKKITFSSYNNVLLQQDQMLGMVPKYVCPVEGVLQMGKSRILIEFINLKFLCNSSSAFEVAERLRSSVEIKNRFLR